MIARMTVMIVLGIGLWVDHSQSLAQSSKSKTLRDLDEAATPIYRPLEEYPTGRWAEFQKEAERLWTTEPDHPYAARAMFDWLLVARLRQSPPADIERVQMRLFMRHSASVYARHLMTIQSPQELRPRLSAWFEQQAELNDEVLSQFGRVVLLGFTVHGPSWLTTDDFGVQSLLAARVAKLAGLAGLLESKFAAAPELTKKILEAGLNLDRSAADRYVQLSEYGDTKSARQIQRALWTQLSTDEKQLPRVQAAFAEQLLREGRLDLVVPIAERLLKEEPDNPRWLLWSGCCLIAANRDADGCKHLQRLAQTKKSSPESDLAKQVLPLVSRLSQSEADCANLLDEACLRIVQSAPQVLSFESEFAAGDGKPVRVQIQVNGSQFAAVCWKDNKPRAGFQCSKDLCRFFTKDEAVVYEISDRQTQPAISVQLTDFASGLNRNINGSLVTEPLQLMAVLQKFLESPALQNGSWKELMKRRRGHGVFTVPIADLNGQKTMRWLAVDLVKMKTLEYGCVLSEGGDFKQLQLDETRVQNIQHGKFDEFKLPKLEWPDYPTQSLTLNDPAGMMRLMTLMTQLCSFDESGTGLFTPPSKPSPQKR